MRGPLSGTVLAKSAVISDVEAREFVLRVDFDLLGDDGLARVSLRWLRGRRPPCRGEIVYLLDGNGLGGGVPTTPWPWSFDLTEDEAAKALEGCPEGGVLVSHSPPKGVLDGPGLGSKAVLQAIEAKRPQLVVCGHIHECAGKEAAAGDTKILNPGPAGTFIEVS